MVTVQDLIDYLQREWHSSTPVVLLDDGKVDNVVILDYVLTELARPIVPDDGL